MIRDLVVNCYTIKDLLISLGLKAYGGHLLVLTGTLCTALLVCRKYVWICNLIKFNQIFFFPIKAVISKDLTNLYSNSIPFSICPSQLIQLILCATSLRKVLNNVRLNGKKKIHCAVL